MIGFFNELSKGDAVIAGGKGASLGEMTQAGIPVPPGYVVLTDAFNLFLAERELHEEIEAQLAKVNHHELETVERASEAIRSLILDAEMPSDIAEAIMTSFGTLGAEFVAVRSSATAEDGAGASWAGELESYLYTTQATLLANVQRCWASLFTPRAIFYRFEQGFTAGVAVAVVIQKMVQSDVSGIAFSVHPVTEDPNQLIIEAGWGLGEAIVSGSVTPDNYVVDKQDFSLIDSYISSQERALYRTADGNGIEWSPVAADRQEVQKLAQEKVLELAHLVVHIEQHYGFPCDIEWAMENAVLYIVQSRPITTLS